MDLIDRVEAIKALTPPESGKYKHVRQIIRGLPAVEAIPIEWIEHHISEIEDDVPNVAGAFKGLIEIWEEEQEKADKKKLYFPKGFFSKERPLAKGEKYDGTD